MEISKLTICRQDVIVVSDTDSESHDINSNKKKRRKRKPQCIRNVKLTTVTINRIVPICYRQRCSTGHHYHQQTPKKTKYQKKETSLEIQCEKRETKPKKKLRRSAKHDDDIDIMTTKSDILCSPITVASSNTYENVSSCSFNIISSDSDELEDLIYSTRKRMKNNSGNFNSFPIRKPIRASTPQDDYQNISSNDEVFNSSIHSLETVLLSHGDPMDLCQESPEQSETDLQHNNNEIDPMLMYKDIQDSHELLQQKKPALTTENNNNLSPLYEISGKVFMEHYLNTSII